MDEFSFWLSNQDVCIQHLYEHLLKQAPDEERQRRIAAEGYGSYLLSQQQANGHWGAYYISQSGLPLIIRYCN